MPKDERTPSLWACAGITAPEFGVSQACAQDELISGASIGEAADLEENERAVISRNSQYEIGRLESRLDQSI